MTKPLDLIKFKLNLKYFLCKFNWNFNSLTVNAYRGYKIVAFGTFWHKILLVVTVTVQTPVPALKLLIINSYRVLGVFLRVLKFFIFLSFWPAIGCAENGVNKEFGVAKILMKQHYTRTPPSPVYVPVFIHMYLSHTLQRPECWWGSDRKWRRWSGSRGRTSP